MSHNLYRHPQVDIPNTGPFNNAQQNSSLKISIRYVLKNGRLEGGGTDVPPFNLTLQNIENLRNIYISVCRLY